MEWDKVYQMMLQAAEDRKAYECVVGILESADIREYNKLDTLYAVTGAKRPSEKPTESGEPSA